MANRVSATSARVNEISSGSSARGGCGPMTRSCRIAINTGARCPQAHWVGTAWEIALWRCLYAAPDREASRTISGPSRLLQPQGIRQSCTQDAYNSCTHPAYSNGRRSRAGAGRGHPEDLSGPRAPRTRPRGSRCPSPCRLPAFNRQRQSTRERPAPGHDHSTLTQPWSCTPDVAPCSCHCRFHLPLSQWPRSPRRPVVVPGVRDLDVCRYQRLQIPVLSPATSSTGLRQRPIR